MATDYPGGVRATSIIPPLNQLGYLPPGIHRASFDEAIARFGLGDPQREAQADSLRWLLPLCLAAGVKRLLTNGSFVTAAGAPNDVDCVLLVGDDYDGSTPAAQRLLAGLPFLELKLATKADYDWFATVLFASDRAMMPKGMVEVGL